jgi:Peptidase family M48
MRWLLVAALAAMVQSVVAEDIEGVLERSQQSRLARRPAANLNSEAAERVRTSWQRLLDLPGAAGTPVELVLVGGPLHAEALLDRQGIVASEAVGDIAEGERMLLLAHELGHLRLSHAQALKAMYRRHIPAEVVREATDPVAAALGSDGHALSHRNELAADAFGYILVRSLGYGMDDAMQLLGRQGMRLDTVTHPGTATRYTQLRELEARLAREQTRSSADALARALAWAASH